LLAKKNQHMVNSFISFFLILFIQASIFIQVGNNKPSQVKYRPKLVEGIAENFDNPVVSPKDILFLVKHNQSPNVVVYQANKTNLNNLDDKKPIDVFWLMNTKGKITENITMIEWKLAFGFKLIPLIRGKKYKISLNAIKDKDITIVQDQQGKVEGFMTLNGHFSKVKEVFIQFEHSFYIPDVKYVQITGNDLSTGKLIVERISAD